MQADDGMRFLKVFAQGNGQEAGQQVEVGAVHGRTPATRNETDAVILTAEDRSSQGPSRSTC
jgi:hypothetical protein